MDKYRLLFLLATVLSFSLVAVFDMLIYFLNKHIIQKLSHQSAAGAVHESAAGVDPRECE